MVQENELFNLLMAVIGLLVFRISLRKIEFPGAAYFRLGFLTLILSFVFTIVEGFVWPRFFNGLEHLTFGVAGVIFCIGCWQMSRSNHSPVERMPEKR